MHACRSGQAEASDQCVLAGLRSELATLRAEHQSKCRELRLCAPPTHLFARIGARTHSFTLSFSRSRQSSCLQRKRLYSVLDRGLHCRLWTRPFLWPRRTRELVLEFDAFDLCHNSRSPRLRPLSTFGNPINFAFLFLQNVALPRERRFSTQWTHKENTSVLYH